MNRRSWSRWFAERVAINHALEGYIIGRVEGSIEGGFRACAQAMVARIESPNHLSPWGDRRFRHMARKAHNSFGRDFVPEPAHEAFRRWLRAGLRRPWA